MQATTTMGTGVWRGARAAGFVVGWAAAVVTGGCFGNSDHPDEGQFDSQVFGADGSGGDSVTVPEAAGGALDVHSASLEGDIGAVRGIDDHAPLFRGWAYDGYASIDVHTALADGSGAAMTIFGITGGLQDPAIRPGAHFEFGHYEGLEPGTVYMTLVGCSGPTEGDWIFDQGAETLDVGVSEGSEPGTIVIDYTAKFPTWDTGTRTDQVVNGTIEVDQAPPQ